MEERQIKENVFKPKFIWDKKWVRPGESIYNIIRNFCVVNSFNGSKAMDILGFRIKSANIYRTDLMLYDHFAQKDNENLLEKEILPQWYLKENEFFYKNYSYSNDNIINPYLCICPRCEKENYHSHLHQIYGMQNCPFHKKTKLIQSNSLYNIASIRSDGIIPGNGEIIILPFQRKKQPDFYKSEYLDNKRNEHVCILPYEHKNNSKMYEKFLLNKEPDKKWVVKDMWDISKPEISKKVVEWIDAQRLPHYMLDIYSDETVSSGLFINNKVSLDMFIDSYIYKKIYDIVKDTPKTENRILKNIIKTDKALCKTDITYLPLLFSWFIVLFTNFYEVFKYKWVHMPYTRIKYNTIVGSDGNEIPSVFSLVSNIKSQLFNLYGHSDITYANPIITIINDYFDMLYCQIRDNFEYYGKFTVFELPQRLSIPEYFAFINSSNKLEIWRYNCKPLKYNNDSNDVYCKDY